MTAPAAKRPVLFFGNDWDTENRTSSHQIGRRLASRYRVFYVECPGLRAPSSSGRDLRKLLRKLRRFLSGRRRVAPDLTVVTLIQLPFHTIPAIRAVNRTVIRWSLRWLQWAERIERPIAWFMVPHVWSLIGALDERVSVYYCIDDYASLQGVDPVAVRAMDEEMTTRADIVFVASETLIESKRARNGHAVLSPHGVDYDHFAAAHQGSLPVPPEMEAIQTPIVGFFGLIESRIDLGLVDALARQRPSWTFVLIGRVAVPPDELPERSNVLLLGPRPYADLPGYAQRFDAAIIPYRLTTETLHASPAKLREYLATGKPIVAVSTPEIEKFRDVLRIGRTAEEFLAHLDECVGRTEPEEVVRRRMRMAAASNWDRRVEEIVDVVEARAAELGR